MLFYWAILVYSLAMNIWGHRLLPTANLVSGKSVLHCIGYSKLTCPQGVLHGAGFVAILVVLAVMAPKNSASFVFTEFVNSSGWESDGVSWLVGLISAVYPFLG